MIEYHTLPAYFSSLNVLKYNSKYSQVRLTELTFIVRKPVTFQCIIPLSAGMQIYSPILHFNFPQPEMASIESAFSRFLLTLPRPVCLTSPYFPFKAY